MHVGVLEDRKVLEVMSRTLKVLSELIVFMCKVCESG